jgi:hypothetical protein
MIYSYIGKGESQQYGGVERPTESNGSRTPAGGTVTSTGTSSAQVRPPDGSGPDVIGFVEES